MVPFTAVYLGIPLPLSRHVVLPTSSGCAAGTCYADAVLAGLLELIERDSLMLWWLHQLPLPRLRPERLEGRWAGLVSELIDRAGACGVRTELFDVTSDPERLRLGPPSFVVPAACS